MNRFRYILFSALTVLAGGCQVKGSLGAGGRNTQPEPPPPSSAAETTAGSGQPGGAEGYSADCPNPENHCLADDVLFAGTKPFTKGHIYLQPARMVKEPAASGKAELLGLQNGETLITEHFWSTRPAVADDLVVGRIVVMLHRQDKNVYRRPRDRKEAESTNWWLARIVNVVPLDRGQVVVSGGYVVAADAIRVLDEDSSLTAVVGGPEDAHFLRRDHWLISNKPLPARGHIYGHVGIAIQTPSPQTKNQGHFINAQTGELGWTSHAWRTRAATKDTIKVGDYVFMLHRQDKNLYRAPKSREEAMATAWWVAKVVDTSEMFKGVIGVAGGYKVSVDAARVILR